MINLIRFTGYRIRFADPKTQPYKWAELAEKVAPLAQLIDLARQEPHYLDDMFGGYSSQDLLMMALKDGEIFACFEDDKLKAIAILRDIVHERHAFMEAYVLPEFRSTRAIKRFCFDFLDYAFREFDELALGLKKIKAEVNINNRPALRACARMGFKTIGVSPCETLCHGRPEHTVLLELLNPRYFSSNVGDRLTNAQLSQGTGDADLCSASTIRSPGRSTEDSTAGTQSNSGNESGRGSGEDAPAVVAAEQRPDEPRRKKPVRSKL